MKLFKFKPLIIALPFVAVCFTFCNNDSTTKTDSDTSTNIIDPTTPAQDIPTPANDSLAVPGKDSIKK